MPKNPSNVITIGIGQCGIQLCTEFYESLSNTQQDAPFWKHAAGENNKRVANSVLIDMEPKVIQDSLDKGRRSDTWGFSEAFYCKQSGSANNWAFGYNTHGPREIDNIMDLVRREAEETDYLQGFLSMMSLAGGTGSGLGKDSRNNYLTGQELSLMNVYGRNFPKHL
jgi:tubulin delta